MKNVLFLLFILGLNGCGSKGGSPTEKSEEIYSSCIFSQLTSEQVHSIRNNLATSIEEKFSGRTCDLQIYLELSNNLIFQILAYRPNANILNAIESQNLSGFLINILDGNTCEVKTMDQEDINNIKNCKWE